MKECPCGIAAVDCTYHKPPGDNYCHFCGHPLAAHVETHRQFEGAMLSVLNVTCVVVAHGLFKTIRITGPITV